jgi:heterodisulfide reductase subunit A
VHCEKVARTLGELSGVVVSRTDLSLCSNSGQAQIEADIREKGVNRVVIGACSPSLHEATFRATLSRAGLNPYLYSHIGIREQASWVHHDDPEGATDKTTQLMAAAVAKVKMLEPLEPIRLNAKKQALVIGGGVAGLRSALDIARCGIQVILIEKSPFLGGRVTQLNTVFPTEDPARQSIQALIEQVIHHPNVCIHNQAQLDHVSGYLGDFHIRVRLDSRGVTADTAEAFMDACEMQVADPFTYGLTQRKLIYRPYDGCYPPTPAVDWENCPDGKLSLVVDGKVQHLENAPEILDFEVGAIVVATGFEPYQPSSGEYGYEELPQVITLPQLICLLGSHEEQQPLRWNGYQVRDLAIIHCVGSRQIEGIHSPQPDGEVNTYCSRVCCTASLHCLKELRTRFPRMNLFDIYQDIRAYGRWHEAYYTEALKNGVRFLRYQGEELPEVLRAPAGDSHPVIVKVKDYLTWGTEIEVPVDLVVLAVGMMPRNIEEVVRQLKIARGTDRFLLEVHPKLRPVETAVPGVVLAGTAQGPMNTQEACASASAAAAKVAVLLGKGFVELEPFVAVVDQALCNGCGSCVAACCYENAVGLEKTTLNGSEVERAVVNPANCVGCGVCVSVCPPRAIQVQGWTLGQYEAMVDAIAEDYLSPVEAG